MAAKQCYLLIFMALCGTAFGGVLEFTTTAELSFNDFPASTRFFDLQAATPAVANSFGSLRSADPISFPYLGLINSVSSALLQFQPRTIALPHTHPRSAEFVYVTEGTLTVGIVDELAANQTVYTFKVQAGQTTVFPQGLLHFIVNESSNPASFLAVFPSPDPGTQLYPPALVGLPPTVLGSAFGVDAAQLAAVATEFNIPLLFGPLTVTSPTATST